MVNRIKQWLQTLSFRTGVIVLLCCIPFYILSFAQMLLPISAAAKGVLWTGPLRHGKDLPVWRSDHPRCRGLPAVEELV